RSSLAVLLARAISERADDLAKLPIASRLGFLRDQYLSDRERPVPAAAVDPRLRTAPRPHRGNATEDLHGTGTRLARHAQTVAPPRIGDDDHGRRHPPGRGLGAHDCLVRFFDGAGP